jgi:hypothetical protein
MRRLKLFCAAASLVGLAACSNELKVTEVQPPNGISGGGEEVVIRGNGFQLGRGVTVKFGNKDAGSVVVASSDRINVATPPGDPNSSVDVIVIFDDGKAFKLPGAFHYIQSGIDRKMMNNALNQMGGAKK